jgi:hypothetical protein
MDAPMARWGNHLPQKVVVAPAPVGEAQRCEDATGGVDAAKASEKPCARWVPNPPDGVAGAGRRAVRAREVPQLPRSLLARSAITSLLLGIEMEILRLEEVEKARLGNRLRRARVEI